MLIILDSIVNMIEEPIWPLNEHKNLHHIMSKVFIWTLQKYEANAYGLDSYMWITSRSRTNCRGCVTTCLVVENSVGPETHMLGFDGGVEKHGGSNNEELTTKVLQTLLEVLGTKTQKSMLSDISNRVWGWRWKFHELGPPSKEEHLQSLEVM